MKYYYIILITLIPILGQAHVIRKVTKTATGVEITLPGGVLSLHPMSDNAIRVRFTENVTPTEPSLVFSTESKTPDFKLSETNNGIEVSTRLMKVLVNREDGAITFNDSKGKTLLHEKSGSRLIKPSSISGEKCLVAQQSFISPKDEYLFGTGQFQDGFLNIKGLTRRLTQVNTQISIPFIVSSKGYGLLWHNYGLTDFNPADSKAELAQVNETGETITVDVTTSEGSRKETRQNSGFAGTFEVAKKGRYAILLDVGQNMARKYNVVIDNKEVINFNNYWLPPTTSTFVELEAGTHKVLVNGEKSDKPVLYYRLVTDETTFRSPVANALDYVFFAGKADEIIASYRQLSGGAPMMPIWSLGYIHCRERYKSQNEIIENLTEFRNRKLPIDLIVQDWQYWGKYGWNAMQFDEKDYPDPAKMVQDIHQMNARLMVSVWSKIDEKSDLGKEFSARNFYIPNTQWVDFFNPTAADFYWKNFSEKLLKPYKIDAWWQDATEPENDDLRGRRINNGTQAGETMRNIYPLFVTKTVYEGSRHDVPEKRVFILTRSAFSGTQRYASAFWSGDIGNDWETLRRQITAGLNLSITGLPYWTVDAGGFFRPGNGQYTDSLYHERFLRWFQFGTFCPLQRVHGYLTDTEFWRFGENVEKEALKYLNLRYRLLPYIYSQAATVTFEGGTIMRPLVMDFSLDHKALEQNYEYMFGPSILVAPVLEPGVKTWDVYLPKNKAGWYNFWTGKKNAGGQQVKTDAPIDQIPLFVKAGSIVPLGPEKQYTSEKADSVIELRVYAGADATFKLYEDDGVSYNYEQGKYATILIQWDDRKKELLIGERKGEFENMLNNRKFEIVLVDENSEVGMKVHENQKIIKYVGKKILVSLD